METIVPKNFPITHLPYLGEKKRRRAKHRKYAVHAQIDGTLPKIGASFATLEAALRKAAKISEEYGAACVMDQSKATGQRMIRLFKRGVDFFDTPNAMGG